MGWVCRVARRASCRKRSPDLGGSRFRVEGFGMSWVRGVAQRGGWGLGLKGSRGRGAGHAGMAVASYTHCADPTYLIMGFQNKHLSRPRRRTTKGIGFRVLGFGFRVSGLVFRVSGLVFRVSCFGFRVSGFGLRVEGFTEPQSRPCRRCSTRPRPRCARSCGRLVWGRGTDFIRQHLKSSRNISGAGG